MFLRSHQSARICIALGALISVLLQRQMVFAESITVGSNVQVSADLARYHHDEVLVAADPRNANRLVACSIVSYPDSLVNGGFRTVAYASGDGGASWSKTLVAGFGDPACAFGPNGTAYFTTMPEPIGTVLDYYSRDGGMHWKGSQFLQGRHLDDRDFVAVDESSRRYRGRVYISGLYVTTDFSGNFLGGIGLYHSSDGGRTFGSPAIAIPEQNLKDYQVCNLTTLSDGTVIILAQNQVKQDLFHPPDPLYSNANLRILRSTDGGITLGKVTKVADIHLDERELNDTIPALIAADSSTGPFKDRLYVVWTEYAFNRTKIYFSYSRDKGNTWSRPRAISDDGPSLRPNQLANNLMPTIAVNNAGVVGVLWYDRRDNPDNQGYYARFTASLDGGEDWLPSVRVSSQPKTLGEPNEKQAVFAFYKAAAKGDVAQLTVSDRDWFTGGHTAGLAAAADRRFHAVWVDNRTGIHQLWTSAITVNGAVRDPESALAGRFDDITASVTPQLTNIDLDAAARRLSADLRLKNSSTARIAGPLRMRISGITSESARLSLLDDPTATQTGETIDVSGIGPRGLAPGQAVSVKTLVFRLDDYRPGSPLDAKSLLDFSVRAYAKPKKTRK